MKRPSTKSVVVVGVLVALLVAGVASFYASSHPDGLEYVAEKTGFLDTAEEHGAAGGPLADYQTRGVDNGRLSTLVAGVTGAVVVLVLFTGLTLVLRRRGAADTTTGDREKASA
jgi:hypothetical protein